MELSVNSYFGLVAAYWAQLDTLTIFSPSPPSRRSGPG